MERDARPVVAVSMGDPLGIGPEVVVRALADERVRRAARHVVFGAQAPMLSAARAAGVEPFWRRVSRGAPGQASATADEVTLVDDDRIDGDAFGAPAKRGPTKAGGDASFGFVEDAIGAVRAGAGAAFRASAIVTAPISKEAWALAGHSKWPGHTELLAARFQARRTAMMFVSPRLRVVLATTHIPLMSVASNLTMGRIVDAIELAGEACARLGTPRARVAVCGLNPHAGEGGLLGEEDQRVIAPAIEAARTNGVDATGPWPADTVFQQALAGKFDVVVAMYHDQGLIPVKTFFRDEAVNVTIGLPAPRTSPDHGTAYDIAGRGMANPGSMRCALELAAALCAGRPLGEPARGS